uniref:DMT family transporter n=1 Tax=Paractinoplanes polyasparticus TaxID=2856853 RepID=UPI001C8636F1|nr:DMT family transporter [Actinoplanes polyasparticus]
MASLWGTIGPASEMGAGTAGAGALAGWRHLVAGLVMTAMAFRHWATLRRAGRSWWLWVVTAGVASAAYQVVFLTSISMSGAALGTMVGVAAVPLFAALGVRFLDRGRVNRAWMLGSAVALAGCVLLLTPEVPGGTSISAAGVACGICAGALFAAYTYCAKQIATRSRATGVNLATGVTMLVGAALLAPLLLTGLPHLTRMSEWLLIAWLGLVATAVAYALYSHGLREVKASTAGTLSLFELPSAALLSMVLLGERLSPVEWLGSAVILAGLLLATARSD